jgi:hypothetical protein
MNNLTYIALVMGAAFAVSQSAVADDMAGMKMGPAQ